MQPPKAKEITNGNAGLAAKSVKIAKQGGGSVLATVPYTDFC
jgi:hypothetical protein